MTPPMTHSEPAREAVALLPCPFCGGKAAFEEIPAAIKCDGVTWSVGCSNADEAACPGYQLMTSWPTKGEARAAWNRRASPAPAAGVEAVQEIEAIFRRHLQANDYAKDLIKRIAFDVVPTVRKALSTDFAAPAAESAQVKFSIGDRVRKTKGSRWQGRVVGTYSTALTPEGYAVESETEVGSVQIYPASALDLATDAEG